MAETGTVGKVSPRELMDAVRGIYTRVDWSARRFAPETPQGAEYRRQRDMASLGVKTLMERFDITDVRWEKFSDVWDRVDFLILLRLKVDLELVRTGYRPDSAFLGRIEELIARLASATN